MKTLSTCFIILILCRAAFADERIVIYLLDPRVVTNTTQTFPIGWENRKTDIIASRSLSETESLELRSLLEDELGSNTNVPFCGHWPAYGVTILQNNKPISSVTLCGLCMTWAKGGSLMVLEGNKAIDFLMKKLPVPDAFAEVKIPPELLQVDKRIPHFKLTAESFKKTDVAE